MKLKRIALEAQEPVDSDQWDDWKEYLDYFEYDIEKLEIAKIIKKFGLEWDGYFKNRIIKIDDKKGPIFLSHDVDNETFSLIKDINQWVWDTDSSEVGVDPENIYNNWVESSLKDLCKNPGNVYHYTTEEKWGEIQNSGQMIGSYGTGINNRGAYGIFTSTDPEEYALGSYGPVCLELNLEMFKKEMNLPELNLQFEPQVLEYLSRDYLLHALELDYDKNEIDNGGGISPYTVIVNHVIPVKYIRHIN